MHELRGKIAVPNLHFVGSEPFIDISKPSIAKMGAHFLGKTKVIFNITIMDKLGMNL